MTQDPGEDEVYCRDCGATIKERAEICPECGIRQRDPVHTNTQSSSEEKDSGLAAVASFIIPGLGQVYNGQIAKGIIAGIVVIGLALTGVGLLLAFPIWIWLVYDAYSFTPSSPGDTSSERSSHDSVLVQHSIKEKEAVREALDWYQDHGPQPGLTESAKKRYQNATSVGELSDARLHRIQDAIDAYREEHESSRELETVREDIGAELETRQE